MATICCSVTEAGEETLRRKATPKAHTASVPLPGRDRVRTGASVSASPKTPRTDTFRVGLTGASVQFDPALAYITTAWELEYATCAKLVNYPDTPWAERRRRASARRSQRRCRRSRPTGGRTRSRSATTSILPTGERVRHRSEHEVHLRANAQPDMASPAQQFFGNIVGATEYMQRAGNRDHRHRRKRRHADDQIDPAPGGVPHVSRDAVHLCGADRPPARRASGADPLGRPLLHLGQRHRPADDREPESELPRGRDRNASTRSSTT